MKDMYALRTPELHTQHTASLGLGNTGSHLAPS